MTTTKWTNGARLPAAGARARPGDAAGGSATIADLTAFVAASRRLVVLTGAGVSTDSGIPDYRDPNGQWKQRRPVMYQDFISSTQARQRYWGRSLVGWRRIAAGQPNTAHAALASLEAQGRMHHLITQNVDGLHQRAGSSRVTDLHGRLDTIECLTCGERICRATFQDRLEAMNPRWHPSGGRVQPDGDVELRDADYDAFVVPGCGHCGGMLKPSVVFFGENVPKPRVAQALARLAEGDALLVVGSSLMVFSGYRFVREARRTGKPVAVVNLGRTRADSEVGLRIEAACGRVLPVLADALAHSTNACQSPPWHGYRL